MSSSALPRADAARTTGGMFFSFGRTSMKGLSIAFWLLLLYFFIGFSAIDEEWASIGRHHPRYHLGMLLLIAVMVRVLRASTKAGKAPAPRDGLTTAWCAYMFATVLSALWAFDMAETKAAMKETYIPSFLCFIVIVMLVRTRREFLLLVLVFCLAHGIYLVRSYTEFFAGRVEYTMGVKRMIGAGSANADPNSFAATILFALPIVLWAGLHTRSRLLQLCAASYGILTALAVILTRSRGGLIMLVIAAAWFVWTLPTRRARTFGIVVLVLLSMAATSVMSENAIKRYVGILTGGSTESERKSTAGRFQGYRVAWKIFKARPTLGVGPGGWASYRSRRLDGYTMYPHNLGGQAIATFGVVGTLAFLVYLVSAFVRAHRERRRRKAPQPPWESAIRSFVGAMVFTLVLLLVSGLAAHNLERWVWFWAPGLLLAAVSCRVEAADVVDGEGTP